MKATKLSCLALAAAMLVSGCSSLTKTGIGALAGAGGGAALGAGLGAIIGGGRGAGLGAAIGTAVGAGAGALIGNRMQQQQQQLEQQLGETAKIESVQDKNGLKAIKVVFNGQILFGFNSTTLSNSAKNDLRQFAASLNNNPDTDVTIDGYTDNVGSMQANERVATGRADAVRNYLINCGVAADRLQAYGLPMQDYIASNDTEAGRAQNRRVEIYITASQEMIRQAEAGTLKQ